MRKIIFSVLLLNVMFFLCYTPLAFSVSRTTSSSTRQAASLHYKTFSLAQLVGSKDVVLTGLDPSYLFYIQHPKQWHLKQVELDLIVSHSSILNHLSTLTVFVNHTPIKTIRLTDKNHHAFHWSIHIPASYLKKPSTAIEIAGYLKVSDDVCSDLENKGNWVKISKDSSLSYQYATSAYQANLQTFPYPLIQPFSPLTDHLTLVVPGQLSFNRFKPAFIMANALGQSATWKGLNIQIRRLANLSLQEKKSTNLIFIGQADTLKLNRLGVKWPLKFNTQGLLLNSKGQPLSKSTGIIMVAKSPWSAEHAVVAITGNTEQAAQKAAQSFYKLKKRQVILNKTYARILKTNTLPERKTNWEKVTLSSLGYQTQVVYGDGQHSINYTFNLPGNITPAALKLNVHYRYARLLSKEQSSYLLAVINGMPAGEVQLFRSKKSTDDTWALTIPGQQLRAGPNQLQLVFNLKSLDKGCSRRQLDKVWGVIYDDSGLKLSFDSRLPTLQLRNYPQYLAGRLTVALPSGHSAYKAPEIASGLVQLASQLHSRTLQVIQTSSLKPNMTMQKTNLLYIGSLLDNPLLSKKVADVFGKLQQQLKKYTGQTLLMDKTTGLPLSLDGKRFDGLLQAVPSPYTHHHALLLISGNNSLGMQAALQVLTSPKKRQLLNKDVAFIYKNGSFTMLDTSPLKERAKKSSQWDSRLTYLAVFLLLMLGFGFALKRYLNKRK